MLEFPIGRRANLPFEASDVMQFHRVTTFEAFETPVPSGRYDTLNSRPMGMEVLRIDTRLLVAANRKVDPRSA